MTTSTLIMAILSKGPHAESAVLGAILARMAETPSAETYERAVILCKNALTDLLMAKRIEMVGPAYRLSEKSVGAKDAAVKAEAE